MIKCIESGISGKSLKPNYPAYVKDLAMSLGLKGFVYIRKDGSIKTVAQGEEEDLVKFSEELEKENFLSPVENFYVKWHEPEEELGDFYVIDNEG